MKKKKIGFLILQIVFPKVGFQEKRVMDWKRGEDGLWSWFFLDYIDFSSVR